MEKIKRALFVSYNAAEEPVVRSQVLPYLQALSKDGVKFTLLTFEKDNSAGGKVEAELKSSGIEWVRMAFHSRPLFIAKPFDLISGMVKILWLCASRKFVLIHARGVMAAVMALVPAKLTGARLLFDMKSSLAEAYRLSGRLKARSILHRALVQLEKICVGSADEVIVETESHKRSLEKEIGPRKRMAISVLPCCVDMERFAAVVDKDIARTPGRLRLVYLGSLSGWYLVSEMLGFFKVLQRRFPGSEFHLLTVDREGFVKRLADEKKIEGVSAYALPYKDVPNQLVRSTAGILFKYPHERLDSFPIKVGEYLASGLPLVINHGMGDVEALVVDDRVGVVVRSFDGPSYSEAIDAFMALLKEGTSLKRRCIEAANRHLSLSYGFAQYRDIYRKV